MQRTLDLAFVDIQLNIVFTKLRILSTLSTVRANMAITFSLSDFDRLLCKSTMNKIIKNNMIFLFTFEYMTDFKISNVLVFLAGYISTFALILLDYIWELGLPLMFSCRLYMRELTSKIKSKGCYEEKAYLSLNITSMVKIMKPDRIELGNELEYGNTMTKLAFMSQNEEWCILDFRTLSNLV